MAVDEALLDTRAAAAPPPPTLRLYGWSPPALSFGRSQAAVFDAEFLAEERIALVRRPTGGLAVLHEHERTYALCGDLRSPAFPGGVVDTYRRVAAALATGLRALGVAVDAGDSTAGASAPAPDGAETVCFRASSTHEITVGGRKLLGSAQLRRRGAFLQHGSLPIRFDAARTARALGTDRPIPATDLTQTAGRRLAVEAIDRALAQAFATSFGVRLVPGELNADERLRATRLYSWKYSSLAWTLEGRYGERELRWGP